MDGTAAGLLAAVNQQRQQGATCGGVFQPAVPPLKLDWRLSRAAALHAQDMIRKNFFSHVGSNGSSVGQRVTAQDYRWRGVGENIAFGQRSVEQVVAAWMDSPGHCSAIMREEFEELGAARVENHWVLVFALPL